LVADREVNVGEERQAAVERQAAMVDELRKAELVRDRLESLEQLVSSYPEGHDTRVLLETLHLERALRTVEEDIGALRDALIYPRGT
jgi:trehalose-6-phosphate synthase